MTVGANTSLRMRKVRFRDPAGSVRVGEWIDDAVEFGSQRFELEDIDLLPPTDPSKIVCVGLNYANHAAETDSDIPDRPLLFLKTPNTLAGAEDTITLPESKDRIDFEGELGVVIGEQCRNVAEEDAESVIAGYTCVNDLSNRDDQRVEQNWVRGKSFDNSAPIGPVMATPEDVPEEPRVRLWLNGEKRQDSDDDELVFDVGRAISEVSTFLTLEPGDIVAMGTTVGVGPLSDGDTVEIEVEGVGRLEHDVEA